MTELGKVGGEIEAKNPILILHKLAGDRSVDVSYYRAISKRLCKKGIVTIEEATQYTQIIKLTGLGREYAAQIKSLSLLDELTPNSEHLAYGTGFTILEYILENSNFTDNNGVQWLRLPNAQERVLNFLANELGLSESALARRVYDLRVRKKYVVQEKMEEAKKAPVTNLGLTPEGAAWIERAKERVEGEKPYSDEELEEVISMTQTAIELAESTGFTVLAEELREKHDIMWLLNLNKVQFEEHTFWLERTLIKLREEYVFENK